MHAKILEGISLVEKVIKILTFAIFTKKVFTNKIIGFRFVKAETGSHCFHGNIKLRICFSFVFCEIQILFILSGGLNTFKTESYEQLNDVRFEGFNLNNPSSNELVQIHTPAKDLL